MLQALVYTAHISRTFPTNLQYVWEIPLGLPKLGSESFPGQPPEDVRSRSVEILDKRMSEIESKIRQARAIVQHILDAPSESNRKARMLLPCLTLNIAIQGEGLRTRIRLLTDIVPDILPHLGGLVVQLRSTTGAFSKISMVLGQQIPSKMHQYRKSHYEMAAGQVSERVKACPLCAEQGRGKVTHTYQQRFARWPTPDHVGWPS